MHDARAEGGRHQVPVTGETARAAEVRASGQILPRAPPAQAVARERRRPSRHFGEATAVACGEHREFARDHARGEGVQGFPPELGPGGKRHRARRSPAVSASLVPDLAAMVLLGRLGGVEREGPVAVVRVTLPARTIRPRSRPRPVGERPSASARGGPRRRSRHSRRAGR